MQKKSKYKIAIHKAFKLTEKNINISAVAGSGKTTILLELLKLIPENKSSLFLAFNNSIVDELRERNERKGVEIMTIHSAGWRLLINRYGKVKMNPNKSIGKTEKVLKEFKIQENLRGYYFYLIPKVLDLMRSNLCPNEKYSILELSNHYDIDITEDEVKMIMKAFTLLIADKSQFDFTDMIYVPVIDSTVRFKKYEYVFCDESQDFSVSQHQFIKKCLNERKSRLITVGDPRQAIYGFAGADAESYSKLSSINGKSVTMPLSVCYRCGTDIVKEASKIVPEIKPAPGAITGNVKQGSLIELEYGDWVLCRNLKPLVQCYLWLLKNKIKAKIKGRDIGESILALINKTGAKTIDNLFNKLESEEEKLVDKLKSRGVKKVNNHPKMEILQQKIEVIQYLASEVSTIKALKDLILEIFTDEIKGIMLSTIHKSKGLENDRIFFLAPELIPSKFATMPWQYEQENNLYYVAVTRARKELIYVRGTTFINDIRGKIVLTKK